MAIDFDWAGFRALCKRLDDLLGSEREDDQFAEDLRRALTFVYTAGITMPTASDVYEAAGGDEFWNATDVLALDDALDPAEKLALAEALAARITESVEAVQPDAIGEIDEINDVATTAAENLLDVAANLSAGSKLFDEKRAQEAQWEWTFGFDEWGAHALGALSALHELLWGSR